MSTLKGVTYNNAFYFSDKIASICKQMFPYSDSVISKGISSGLEPWERSDEFKKHERNLHNAANMMDEVMERSEEDARKWIEEREEAILIASL